jgi:hypothetical protein
MAQETEPREDQGADEQANGGNGGRKAALRAAAIAAATGATAIAAKKALSKRDQSGEERPKSEPGSSGDDESIVADMLASGWDAAKNSLLPFAEDAAGAAGEWVGQNGPELLRDALVPRFIRGFERTRKSADTDE